MFPFAQHIVTCMCQFDDLVLMNNAVWQLLNIVSNKQLIVSTQDRFEASVAHLSLVHSRRAYHFLKRNGCCSVAILVIKVVER